MVCPVNPLKVTELVPEVNEPLFVQLPETLRLFAPWSSVVPLPIVTLPFIASVPLPPIVLAPLPLVIIPP